MQRAAAPTGALPYAGVTGGAPGSSRHLGPVRIGLDTTADPAGTATVGAVLDTTDHAYGLTRVDLPGGATTAGDVGGLTARTTAAAPPHGASAMAFDVADDVAATGAYDAKVTVSYFDVGAGDVALRYDAGPGDTDHDGGGFALTGSGTWKTAELTVKGAYFGGLAGAGTDFRLQSAQPLTVHSVGVDVTGAWVPDRRAFPPAPVITTPRGGATVKLASSFSGTAVPDGAVTVHEGSAALCATTADDTGAWSCAPAGGLTAGRQTVTATAADPTGLTGDASAAVSFDASDLPPGTAVVGAVVGATDHAYGMSEDEKPSGGFDGPTTASVVGGLSARTSTEGNIYFDIDDTVAHAGSYDAVFTVAYYDQGAGSISVQYDDGTGNPYRSTSDSIPLTGTDTWKTATVSAPDAYFGGQQHSGADFRLRNGGGQVTVHAVAVKVSGDGVPDASPFAPPVTVTAPAAGATVTATPTVTGTAEPGAEVTVTAEGARVCAAAADDGGAWTCTAPDALGSGGHTLTATAADPTGTQAAAGTVEVTVQ